MGLITRYCHHLKLIFPSCVLCYFKLYVTKPAYVQKLLCGDNKAVTWKWSVNISRRDTCNEYFSSHWTCCT